MSREKVIRLNRKRKKLKRKKRSIYSLTFLLLITLSLLIMLTAPGFAIQKVSIEGNQRFSNEEVEEILGINKQKNIFYFLLRNKFYNDEVLNPYVDDVSVEVSFPNAINVYIKEREVVGYVPYLGTYLCIDKEGRVLDTSIFIDENVPIIMGLDFDGFNMNQVLNVDNQETFDEMVNLISYLVKYEALSDIIKVDMTNMNNMVMYTKDVEVKLGVPENLHKKVQIMVQALKEVQNLRGILNISNLNQPVTFKKS